MINPKIVHSSANTDIELITVKFIKSVIMDYDSLMQIYREARKNIVKQMEDLSFEESALIMPGKSTDNLGIRSSGISDQIFSQYLKVNQAKIKERSKSLAKSLVDIEDKIDFYNRVLQMFHLCSKWYPIHYGVVENYLYNNEHGTMTQKELETKFNKTHTTLMKMVNDLCELVGILVVHSMTGEEVDRWTLAELNSNLSKEIVKSLEKHERTKDK